MEDYAIKFEHVSKIYKLKKKNDGKSKSSVTQRFYALNDITFTIPKGEVVGIGNGKVLDNGQRSPIDVKIGEIVYFTQYAPDEIEVDENGETVKYLVIKHASLLAKE